MCGRAHRLEYEWPDPDYAAQEWSDERISHVKPDPRFDGISRSLGDCIKSIACSARAFGAFGVRSCPVRANALRCL